ncbi:hypothetical protein M8A51_19855 [Schlegelella sp. S2-27]|uniref:Transposase n=1 Tax=Caldimonas mangrovi TaxID=2944811 RepID=A0ABT0YSR1_9BURK|nr:hypothetical protein [Caldimonas mangrovi]
MVVDQQDLHRRAFGKRDQARLSIGPRGRGCGYRAALCVRIQCEKSASASSPEATDIMVGVACRRRNKLVPIQQQKQTHGKNGATLVGVDEGTILRQADAWAAAKSARGGHTRRY